MTWTMTWTLICFEWIPLCNAELFRCLCRTIVRLLVVSERVALVLRRQETSLLCSNQDVCVCSGLFRRLLPCLSAGTRFADTNCFGGKCDLAFGSERKESGQRALSAGQRVGFVRTKSCLWKYIQVVCVLSVRIYPILHRWVTISHQRRLSPI